MHDWLILLLGILQGLTEFLPISSSAHLLLLGNLSDLSYNFEVAVLLNGGTLAALIYWNRQLLKELIAQLGSNDYQLAGKLAVAILPAGLLGFLLTDFFKDLAEQIPVILIMLAGIGTLMFFKPPTAQTKTLSQLSWLQASLIGGLQALALIPGTSRSGITILAGLWLGLQQEVAIRWSFLLAIPLVTGAILRILMTAEAQTFVTEQALLLMAGNILAFGVSLLALRWLLQLVRRWSLRPFGYYRWSLALVILGWYLS